MHYAGTQLEPYLTRDVYTDPPSVIAVVGSGALSAPVPPEAVVVRVEDVEVTEGWLTRHHKTHLSVCFMHSFGKCSGSSDKNPATCHQVHIRREVLNALRATYRNPIRMHFSRTVKAYLSEDLRRAIARMSGKELSLRYIEYRAADLEETDGMHAYEHCYRAWLLSSCGPDDTTATEGKVFQCASYATLGHCPAGRRCPNIHGDMRTAQIRDKAVMYALQHLCSQTEVAPPHAQFHPHHHHQQHLHPRFPPPPPPPPPPPLSVSSYAAFASSPPPLVYAASNVRSHHSALLIPQGTVVHNGGGAYGNQPLYSSVPQAAQEQGRVMVVFVPAGTCWPQNSVPPSSSSLKVAPSGVAPALSAPASADDGIAGKSSSPSLQPSDLSSCSSGDCDTANWNVWGCTNDFVLSAKSVTESVAGMKL